MKTIKLCIFEPLYDQVPEPVVIEITEQLPDFKSFKDFAEAQAFYQQQATMLCLALHNALPQGTFDRLWIELAKIKTSLYTGKTDG